MAGRTRAVAAPLSLLLAVASLFAAFGAVAPAAGAAPQSAPPEAYVVVDAGTGDVVLASNHHEALPPASTAKVMTALVAAERLPADATVPVSALAAGQPASRINMRAGDEWKLHDALASLLMVSANDAAYAIAERVGGSLEGFTAVANATAHRLGMRDSTFNDPAGFSDHTAFQGGPRASAFDLAVATRNALAVPELAELGRAWTLEFVDPTGATRTLTNHNKMLPEGPRAYPWATGFKTGFTQLAGHTLVATAQRDGRTLIAVVLDTYDIYGWAQSLLDQGFGTAAPADAERLPDVAVSPYTQRLADRLGFSALARGEAVAAATTTTTAAAGFSTPTSGLTATTLALTGAEDGAGADGDGGARAASGDASSGSSVLSLRNVLSGFVVLLALLVILRRRAVRRRRARRLARRRATAAAMRRGSLPVVDGRYRPGTRVGPPVESHVRVHPVNGASSRSRAQPRERQREQARERPREQPRERPRTARPPRPPRDPGAGRRA